MTPAQKLAERLASSNVGKKRTEPLWKGPEVDGITFSLLSRFLVCRERFRCLVVEGLKPQDGFNHRIEYGQMWHICEETYAEVRADKVLSREDGQIDCVFGELEKYTKQLCQKYRFQQEEILHWYNVCKTQFPLYIEYWSKHPDMVSRTPLLQEYAFNVPYKLPSGRLVRLRGKWDSVDLVKNKGIFLMENKTKGDVKPQQIERQLKFDLQTMMYVVALDAYKKNTSAKIKNATWDADESLRLIDKPIAGVRYNVIRRPLSGGEGDIKQKKGSKNVPAETATDFYNRLRGVIDGTGVKTTGENYTGPTHFFMRWNVEISAQDIQRFRRECLDPILEQLCDWWEFINYQKDPFDPTPAEEDENRRLGLAYSLHWRYPFGIYNPVDQTGSSDLDGYLENGNEVGLTRTDELFPELK